MGNSLLSIYNKGFLPGPDESKNKFFERIEKVEKILQNPSAFFKKPLTPLQGCFLLEENSKNLFFHGSSTLIYQIEEGINFPIIKSPSKFSKLFVTEDEILNHELVHARRCQFDESKYEEILAFRTSFSPFRKNLSPIISSNNDLIAFFLAIFFCFISLIPLSLLLLFFSTRLAFRQKTIHKCIRYLKSKTPSYEQILTAMTDEEILFLSKKQFHKIDFTLYRWQFIQTLFGTIL
jgi:hypothetical protein